jgi:hypothetical protein
MVDGREEVRESLEESGQVELRKGRCLGVVLSLALGQIGMPLVTRGSGGASSPADAIDAVNLDAAGSILRLSGDALSARPPPPRDSLYGHAVISCKISSEQMSLEHLGMLAHGGD